MTIANVTFNATKTVTLVIPAIVLLVTAVVLYIKRWPKALKTQRFQQKWQALQKLCADSKTWPSAILSADSLLDEALKRRKMGGRNMGERLVQAQRVFSDNDAVWFGHKLRNRIENDPQAKLKESDVKDALIGFRQALKDLGALPK